MPESEIRRDFTGGLRLVARKRMSTALHINRTIAPRSLTIPMTQHSGPAAVPIVEVGQAVHRGQLIGEPREAPSTAVHASLSGHVAAVERRTVPGGNQLIQTDCVIVEVDRAVTDSIPEVGWPVSRPERLAALRDAGIVGLGGAAFPTAAKLEQNDGCHTLILNGAECEPYISCDDVLMREHAREVLNGARTMMELLDAKVCLVAIENDKPVAADALNAAIDEIVDDRFAVTSVPTVYPAGGERQLVEILTGEEVPSGDYPIACGCVCQNVGTAVALIRFLQSGHPVTSRITTITGEGVVRPCNLDIRFGMPIADVIATCGGYSAPDVQLIMGGTMMGVALENDSVPVTRAANCIIAATKRELRQDTDAAMPCIRCGECASVCPAYLLPQELHRAAEHDRFDALEDLGLFDCIECGCCDVVCPSRIRLTESFRSGKRRLVQTMDQDSRGRWFDAREQLRLERVRSWEAEYDTDTIEPSTPPRSHQQCLEAVVDVVARVNRLSVESINRLQLANEQTMS